MWQLSLATAIPLYLLLYLVCGKDFEKCIWAYYFDCGPPSSVTRISSPSPALNTKRNSCHHFTLGCILSVSNACNQQKQYNAIKPATVLHSYKTQYTYVTKFKILKNNLLQIDMSLYVRCKWHIWQKHKRSITI